jgi:hypothetical protein
MAFLADRPRGSTGGGVRALASVVAVLAVAAAVGCGDDSADDSTTGERVAAAASPDPVDFPKAAPGKTLRQFAAGLDTEPARLRLATSVYTQGHSRVGFSVMRDGEPVYAPTVIYAAPPVDPPEVAGPTAANADLLVADPDDGDGLVAVYDARALDMHHRGRYQLLSLTETGGGLLAGRAEVEVIAERRDRLPKIGSRLRDTGVAAIGRRPVVLAFDDTANCGQRVCVSPREVAGQLQRRYGDQVAFVEGDAALRRRLGLPAGPWVLSVDSTGRVAARMEGAIGTLAFERAIQAAIARSPDR